MLETIIDSKKNTLQSLKPFRIVTDNCKKPHTPSIYTNFVPTRMINKLALFQAGKLLRIQRRGATLALTSLTASFGENLPEKLPKLWEFISEPFANIANVEGEFLS